MQLRADLLPVPHGMFHSIDQNSLAARSSGRMGARTTIESTRTTILLSAVKEFGQLPLGQLDDATVEA